MFDNLNKLNKEANNNSIKYNIMDNDNNNNILYHGYNSCMIPAIYDLNKCSWACHNSTSNHCIKNHVKIIKPGFPYYKQINDFYWAIINFNSKTTNGKKVSDSKYYAAMNVIFLVILWPLFMYSLLINYLRLRKKIRILENN